MDYFGLMHGGMFFFCVRIAHGAKPPYGGIVSTLDPDRKP